MGTLYFVVKNSIVTVVIVTFMQVSLLGKTVEDRIMNFVRGNFAVKFLGTEHVTINEDSLDLSPEQIKKIQSRFGKSKFMELVKKQAQSMIQDELKNMQSNPSEIDKQLKLLEQQNRQRDPAKK